MFSDQSAQSKGQHWGLAALTSIARSLARRPLQRGVVQGAGGDRLVVARVLLDGLRGGQVPQARGAVGGGRHQVRGVDGEHAIPHPPLVPCITSSRKLIIPSFASGAHVSGPPYRQRRRITCTSHKFPLKALVVALAGMLGRMTKGHQGLRGMSSLESLVSQLAAGDHIISPCCRSPADCALLPV